MTHSDPRLPVAQALQKSGNSHVKTILRKKSAAHINIDLSSPQQAATRPANFAQSLVLSQQKKSEHGQKIANTPQVAKHSFMGIFKRKAQEGVVDSFDCG